MRSRARWRRRRCAAGWRRERWRRRARHDAADVLVASDASADARLIKHLLGGQFGAEALSVDPGRAAAYFEAAGRAAVVLAFRTIPAAQRYSLRLYRPGAAARAALLLCSRDELREASAVHRSGHFDDDVLFWSLNHHPYRLPPAPGGMAARQ